MKLIKLALIAVIVMASTIVISQEIKPKHCLTLFPEDSSSFGQTLATNGKYLAIGDPLANRVVIYQQDSQQRWQRIQEIYPPKGSIPEQTGVGFGYHLDFDDQILVIGTHHQIASDVKTDSNNSNFVNDASDACIYH